MAFFPSLKQNFIAYRSSKASSCQDCIFEIHHLWQSGFSWVYSNSCCSCLFEAEIIKIDQSSQKMYSNNILNFQKSTTILNAYTKSVETYWIHHVYMHAYDLYDIYEYEYIYCHPQIDCFVVSQLISVARRAKCFTQRSNPSWFFIGRLSYRGVSTISAYAKKYFTNIYIFCLHNGYRSGHFIGRTLY